MGTDTLSGSLRTLVERADKLETELFTAWSLVYRYYSLHLGMEVTSNDFAQMTGMSRYRAQLFIHHHDRVFGPTEPGGDNHDS